MTGSTNSCEVQVLYFASLGETLGIEKETITLETEQPTVSQLIEQLCKRGQHWLSLREKNIHCAVNHTLASSRTSLNLGDEVAFFPPVTGG